MKSILDPSFRYTSSAATDVRKTFARIRRELARQQQREREQGSGAPQVLRLDRRLQRA